MTEEFKVGDNVKHRFRNYYQKCTIVEIEEGCNGGIRVECEDGFYGGSEVTTLCRQDITKAEKP